MRTFLGKLENVVIYSREMRGAGTEEEGKQAGEGDRRGGENLMRGGG